MAEFEDITKPGTWPSGVDETIRARGQEDLRAVDALVELLLAIYTDERLHAAYTLGMNAAAVRVTDQMTDRMDGIELRARDSQERLVVAMAEVERLKAELSTHWPGQGL